jgi:pimeloyl-ACP methyl ester carboxylesterase
VHDDLAFLDRLAAEVAPAGDSRTETLGGLSRARDALAVGVDTIRRAATQALTVPPVQFFRRRLGFSVAHGFGDIVAYLADRGTPEQPGSIVSVVADAVARAAEGGGPVVVVAHSMGGNIVYDLLSHYRPDLVVDALVTVGSQVGLFEELKLFAASRLDIVGPSMKVPVPQTIRSWINVVDHADPLSFRASPVFERAIDYVYPSGSVWAHSAYLRQPHFHARLAHRVVEALR